jgi:Cu(I)/Ag(I) efflux system membrane fusion protein
MVIKVIELRLRFIILIAGTGLAFGYWDVLWNHYEKWARPASGIPTAGTGFEFYCPMHPAVVRDDHGICPICGMPLSKREIGAGSLADLPEGTTTRVALSPRRVAQAGVAITEVSYEPLAETLTTVGTVSFDERRLARISSKTSGMSRVETLFVNVTGSEVEAGQPLAELYSPELYQALQELLISIRSTQTARSLRTPQGRSLLADDTERVRLAREKLSLWGLSATQVDEIIAQGRADYRIPILAPIGGIVTRKNVVEGQYISEGEPLLEIADLDHVWVWARFYENELGLVRIGQEVEATVEAFPGEVFSGTVAFIDPTVDPATRTIGVRYDLENPDHRLRPGMFATVSLRAPIAETPAFAGRVAARKNIRLTAQDQEFCPVTNLKLGSMGEPLTVEIEGRRVWICCEGCRSSLEESPGKFLARLAVPPQNAVLSVPESAVIDTGSRKVVYVETDPGLFEGREVELGPRVEDHYPVLRGLRPGDRVASAGAFLIDAETRLNPAAAASYFGGMRSSPSLSSPNDAPLR